MQGFELTVLEHVVLRGWYWIEGFGFRQGPECNTGF